MTPTPTPALYFSPKCFPARREFFRTVDGRRAEVGWKPSCQKVEHIRIDLENLGELFKDFVGRLAAIVFEVHQERNRDRLAIGVAHLRYHLASRQPQLLAPLNDELSKCLHDKLCSISASMCVSGRNFGANYANRPLEIANCGPGV
jgi:hypothetical protein